MFDRENHCFFYFFFFCWKPSFQLRDVIGHVDLGLPASTHSLQKSYLTDTSAMKEMINEGKNKSSVENIAFFARIYIDSQLSRGEETGVEQIISFRQIAIHDHCINNTFETDMY